jgi:hypothetical protein
MPDIPEEAKRQALDAVESIRSMVWGQEKGESANAPGIARDGHNIADAYDAQGMAAAREQQRSSAAERAAERNSEMQREQERGRDR